MPTVPLPTYKFTLTVQQSGFANGELVVATDSFKVDVEYDDGIDRQITRTEVVAGRDLQAAVGNFVASTIARLTGPPPDPTA